MLEIIGDVVTLNSDNYLVICEKKVDNRELYIVSLVASPSILKLMEIREEDNGQLVGRLYERENEKAIFQESALEIMDALKEMREQIRRRASTEQKITLNRRISNGF